MPATFPFHTVYKLDYIGRLFFTTYIDGRETALTEVEASRLVAAGARLIESAYSFCGDRAGPTACVEG